MNGNWFLKIKDITTIEYTGNEDIKYLDPFLVNKISDFIINEPKANNLGHFLYGWDYQDFILENSESIYKMKQADIDTFYALNDGRDIKYEDVYKSYED